MIVFMFCICRPQTKFEGKVIFSEASVILFIGGVLYYVASCLPVWSYVLSGGSLSLVPCSFRGSLSRGSLSRGVSVGRPPSLESENGRYASYWNVFLLLKYIEVLATHALSSCEICSVHALVNNYRVLQHHRTSRRTAQDCK